MKKAIYQLVIIFTCFSCVVERKQQETLDKIKEHFLQVDAQGIELEYTRVSYNAYQSFDYRSPDSLFSYNSIQLLADTFYHEGKAVFPGGFVFEVNEYQKDSNSIFYDVNRILYGNRAAKRASQLENIRKEINEVLDVRCARNLFTEYDSIDVVEFSLETNAIALLGTRENDSLRLTFQVDPIVLKSAEDITTKEKWVYEKQNPQSNSFASKVTYFEDGQHKRDYLVQGVKTIDSIDPAKLELPEGVTLYEKPSTQPTIEQLGTGLFVLKHLPADRNVMFSIDRSDVIVFGAPVSDSISKQVIDLIKEHFPEKTIKYVYVTHFHSDHIRGLKAYSDIGSTILTDDYTIEAIKAYPKFSQAIEAFTFESINQITQLDDIYFYEVPNSHSYKQSFAYFKKSGTIYQGDFLEIPADNSLPNYLPETSLQFYNFIKSNGLKVTRIVGHHRNHNISMTLLDEYVSRF